MQPDIDRFLDHGDRNGLRAINTGSKMRSILVGAVGAGLLGGSHRSGVPGVIARGLVRIVIGRLNLALVARLTVVRRTCVGEPGHQRQHPDRQRQEDAAVNCSTVREGKHGTAPLEWLVQFWRPARHRS